MTKQRFLIAAAVLLMASQSYAGTVVLTNGDRITGDIKRIWDGDVAIEPEYADEFTIDQDKIAYMESDKRFEFEYVGEDMNKRIALFKGAGEDGRQIVVLDGEETVISFMQIGEMEEEEDFFDWSVNADLNAEINRGNTDNTEIGITSNWYLKYGNQKHYLDTLYIREKQDDPETGGDITTENRQKYTYNLNYDIGEPWFTGGWGSYETDDIKGLEYRYNAIPTLGYKIWDNAGKKLNFQIGYGYEEEETIDENDVKEEDGGGLALFLAKFEYDFGSPDLTLYLTSNNTKSSYGRKNTVSQNTAGAKFEITDLLYFNVETLFDYETDPVEGADNEDLKILIGFGLEFEK